MIWRPRFTWVSEGYPLRCLLLRWKGGLAGVFDLVFHGNLLVGEV